LRVKEDVKTRTKREKRLVLKVLAMFVLLALAYIQSKAVFGAPSRRLCNLPYCLYQIALNVLFLLYLLVLDRCLVLRPANFVESAINYG